MSTNSHESNLSASDFVTKINDKLTGIEKSMIEIGALLNKAQKTLSKFQYKEVESKIPLVERNIQKLKKIAADERIQQYAAHVPQSWGTLYELTKLDDAQFDQAIADKKITPDSTRKEVTDLLKSYSASSITVPPVPEKTELITISTRKELTLEQKAQLANIILLLDSVFEIQSAGFDKISPVKIGPKRKWGIDTSELQKALYEYREEHSDDDVDSKWRLLDPVMDMNSLTCPDIKINYYGMLEKELKNVTSSVTGLSKQYIKAADLGYTDKEIIRLAPFAAFEHESFFGGDRKNIFLSQKERNKLNIDKREEFVNVKNKPLNTKNLKGEKKIKRERLGGLKEIVLPKEAIANFNRKQHRQMAKFSKTAVINIVD